MRLRTLCLALLLAVSAATLAAPPAAEPAAVAATPATAEYSLTLEASWADVDSFMAWLLGQPEKPAACGAESSDAAAEECQRAAVVFSATTIVSVTTDDGSNTLDGNPDDSNTDDSNTEMSAPAGVDAIDTMMEPVQTVAAPSESTRASEYESHAPPQPDDGEDARSFCRSLASAVDTACAPADICTAACKGAAEAATAALALCEEQPLGLAVHACGMQPMLFGLELEAVARQHDCSCNGLCAVEAVEYEEDAADGGDQRAAEEQQLIFDPYCDGELTTLEEMREWRVERSQIVYAYTVFLATQLLVWHWMCSCVERRHSINVCSCKWWLVRLLLFPASSFVTHMLVFATVVLLMGAPWFTFWFCLLLIIGARRRSRRRRSRLLAAARSRTIEVRVPAGLATGERFMVTAPGINAGKPFAVTRTAAMVSGQTVRVEADAGPVSDSSAAGLQTAVPVAFVQDEQADVMEAGQFLNGDSTANVGAVVDGIVVEDK